MYPVLGILPLGNIYVIHVHAHVTIFASSATFQELALILFPCMIYCRFIDGLGVKSKVFKHYVTGKAVTGYKS